MAMKRKQARLIYRSRWARHMLMIFEKTQGDNPPHDTALSQQLSSYVKF